MTFAIADRVKETTATTGTGTLTLAGAVAQFRSFAAVGNANQCNYCILGGNGTDWETGVGTYTSSGTTLSRDTVLASSNSGSKISLTGTSTVFLTEPAAALASRLAAPIIPPAVAASWTAYNSGSLTNVANGVNIAATASGATTIVQGMYLSSPATPYTIDANISAIGLAITTNFIVFGLGWSDATKVQLLAYLYQAFQTAGQVSTGYLTAFNWTNATTSSGGVGTTYYGPYNPADMWMRIADNGTTITVSASPDGVSYSQVYSVAKASGFLGSSGYTKVGLFIDPGLLGNGGSMSVTLRSWWQR